MRGSVWRRNLKLWLPAVAFCLVNIVFLAAYQLVLAEEARIGIGLLDRRAAELERLRGEREDLEGLLARAEETESGIAAYYQERLSSEAEKLTEVIAEIKDLAKRAGLEPGTIRYERDEIERQDVIERSVVFDVVGNYPQLRTLVNFLELSDSFLILEEVSLRIADESGEQLGIELRIAVLFSDAEPTVAGRSEA